MPGSRPGHRFGNFGASGHVTVVMQPAFATGLRNTQKPAIMRTPVVGVMGPGTVQDEHLSDTAYQLGHMLAGRGWTVLTGGRPEGVMELAMKGAKQAGGNTIGVLPSAFKQDASSHADWVICTGMGNARNAINVLSSDVVIACGMGSGTLSEVALALKSAKPVILLAQSEQVTKTIRDLDPQLVFEAADLDHCVDIVDRAIRALSR